MRMIVAFEKTEQVRHTGHLDLLRTMQRALRRSGLPIRYSQGFNPHVVLSFASPLPVGASGAEELMDAALETDVTEDEFAAALSPAMPHSLPLLRVRAVPDDHKKLMAQLRTAAYVATLPTSGEVRRMMEAIPGLLAAESIIAVRKTKSGERPCDIRPMLHGLEAQIDGDTARFIFRVSMTEQATLKPTLLMETLAREADVPWEALLPELRLRRTCLYGEKDQLPVSLFEL